MAQTTQDAPFGPIFVVPAESITYLCIRTYIYTIKVQLITKGNQRKYKKNSPRAQTTHLASFGPVLVVSAYPVAFFVTRTYR